MAFEHRLEQVRQDLEEELLGRFKLRDRKKKELRQKDQKGIS